MRARHGFDALPRRHSGLLRARVKARVPQSSAPSSLPSETKKTGSEIYPSTQATQAAASRRASLPPHRRGTAGPQARGGDLQALHNGGVQRRPARALQRGAVRQPCMRQRLLGREPRGRVPARAQTRSTVFLRVSSAAPEPKNGSRQSLQGARAGRQDVRRAAARRCSAARRGAALRGPHLFSSARTKSLASLETCAQALPRNCGSCVRMAFHTCAPQHSLPPPAQRGRGACAAPHGLTSGTGQTLRPCPSSDLQAYRRTGVLSSPSACSAAAHRGAADQAGACGAGVGRQSDRGAGTLVKSPATAGATSRMRARLRERRRVAVARVVEGQVPRQQLVRHHARRPHVGGREDLRAERLGRHVPGRPGGRPPCRPTCNSLPSVSCSCMVRSTLCEPNQLSRSRDIGPIQFSLGQAVGKRERVNSTINPSTQHRRQHDNMRKRCRRPARTAPLPRSVAPNHAAEHA